LPISRSPTSGEGFVAAARVEKHEQVLMRREMIVSSTPVETRVGIVEDDTVVEVTIEREQSRGVAGNIFKGRVNRVLPGMQSAFVDIGLERDAFLYVSDVLEDVLEEEEADPGLTAEEKKMAETEREIARASRNQTIDELLKEGQEILVQVAKEPIGTKGARITSHVSLPGRLLVYMPTVDHIGVSRKIESAEGRSRLRRMIGERKAPGGGFIVRTAASGQDDEGILADMRFLEQQWASIRKKSEAARAPAVVHRDLGLVFKMIRDMLSPDFTAIRIDSESLYDEVLEYVRLIQPQLLHRIKYYSKQFPIFEEYGIQSEIDKALRTKVWLKSGGYIVINQTEALVAIDVNTGRYTGKRRLEDTITRINMEALVEIVRQIRLRDLGGIVVVDFIDMEERRNQQKVFAAFEEELKRDRAPSKMLQIPDFGLVVLTRKRVKSSLERTLCEPCAYCNGNGWVKSPATVCSEVYDAVRKKLIGSGEGGLRMRVHPEVARALRNDNKMVLKELESIAGRPIELIIDGNVQQEQFEVLTD
jgi:ribonuclease G